MASDIKCEIKSFHPLIPNNPQSPIVCVVRVYDDISGMTVGEQTFQWSGEVLANQTDDEVLEFVMQNVIDYSQSVVAAADETVDRFVEFSRRYSNLIGAQIDIPDVKDSETKITEVVQEKRKAESEWRLEVAVRDSVDLTPLEDVQKASVKGR